MCLRETIDRVLQVCPDVVTSVIPYADYTKQGVEQIRPTVEVLKAAGEQYMETSVLLIMSMTVSEKFTYVVTENSIKEMIAYLEKNNVRPSTKGTRTLASRTCWTGSSAPGSPKARRS